MGKVRIYDLAKELKLESKKILEDARRMGVDVSVASNTLDDAIAAKIREMYYPKKKESAAPTRVARLIKHASPSGDQAAAQAPPPVKPPIQEPVGEPKPAPAIAPAPQVATPVTPAPQITVKTITPPAANPSPPPQPRAPAAQPVGAEQKPRVLR